MKNNNQIKQLIKTINTNGVSMLIVQVLMRHDQDIGAYDIEATEVGYSRYCERLLKIMKAEYSKMLKKDAVVVQDDLESAINRANEGTY